MTRSSVGNLGLDLVQVEMEPEEEEVEPRTRIYNKILFEKWLIAPANFRVESRSETTVQLSWTNQHGPGATTIEIERALGDAAFALIVSLTDLTDTNYQDTGLTSGTRYRYRIRVTDA